MSSVHFHKNKDHDFNLTDVTVYKEDGEFFLSATYHGEDLHEEYEINIPKIALPIRPHELNLDYHDADCLMDRICSPCYLETTIDYPGYGTLRAMSSKGKHFTKTIIKNKKRKMTVAEIEKALGYKVEIISK